MTTSPTSSSIEIRQARADELPVIHELEQDYTDSGETAADIQARYERHPALFLVAVAGDTIVGEASGLVKTDSVRLKAISVLHAYQRRGIGRRLLAEFERRAKEHADVIDLGSGEGGTELFYIACGYEPDCLLVRVRRSELRPDYRSTEYPVTGERDEGEWRLFYVEPIGYGEQIKDAVRATFGAAAVNYIFSKRLMDR